MADNMQFLPQSKALTREELAAMTDYRCLHIGLAKFRPQTQEQPMPYGALATPLLSCSGKHNKRSV